MNMKVWMAGVIVSLMGAAAQATEVVCSGRYLDTFDFVMKGALDSANRITGKVTVTVSTKEGFSQSAELQPTGSDIQPGRHIKVTGTYDGGTGVMEAFYNATAGNYPGTLKASGGSLGDFQVDLTCVMKKALNVEGLMFMYGTVPAGAFEIVGE